MECNMNKVLLIGRLTSDPVVRYSGELAIASFTLAIDRMKKRDGTKETDFPRVKAFGKTAEFCASYMKKGNRVAVEGRIETGSYIGESGEKVFTTEVRAERVEVIDWPEEKKDGEEFFF